MTNNNSEHRPSLEGNLPTYYVHHHVFSNVIESVFFPRTDINTSVILGCVGDGVRGPPEDVIFILIGRGPICLVPVNKARGAIPWLA